MKIRHLGQPRSINDNHITRTSQIAMATSIRVKVCQTSSPSLSSFLCGVSCVSSQLVTGAFGLTFPWLLTVSVYCSRFHLRRQQHYPWEDTSLESSKACSQAALFQDLLAPGSQGTSWRGQRVAHLPRSCYTLSPGLPGASAVHLHRLLRKEFL